MARVNNLTNFLNDVSAAIKQKIGDNTPISAAEFDTKIMEIETVGNYQDKTLTITTNGNYRLEPDANFDAISSVVITANVPTEDLEAEISAQEEYIAQLEAIIDTKAVGSGDGSSMNIFVQETEPEVKKGLWLQTNKEMENIEVDDNVFIGGEWEPDGLHTLISANAGSENGITTINNNIFIFGVGSSNNLAYKYDTLTKTYTQLTNVPFSISRGSVTAVGTDIYLLGGTNNYKYNTLTDTYTQMTNMPYNVNQGTAVSIATNIYIWGGSSEPQNNYKYDTLTDTYTKLANIPFNHKYGKAVAVGTNIYKFSNGYYGSGSTYVNAYKYNTINNTWTKISNIPYDASYGYAVSMGTDIYFNGGYSDLYYQPVNKYFYKYDTLTDTYTRLEDMLYATNTKNITICNNKIYIFDYVNKNVQVYVLESKTYEQDNLVVINQGKYKNSWYETELFCNNKMITQPTYPFNDAWFYTTEDGLITDIPSYYGDGTQWINFKNPPVEEVEE